MSFSCPNQKLLVSDERTSESFLPWWCCSLRASSLGGGGREGVPLPPPTPRRASGAALVRSENEWFYCDCLVLSTELKGNLATVE